jgi:hypothetical protein
MGSTPARRVENAVADTTARVITAVGDAITGRRKPERRKTSRAAPVKRKAVKKRAAKRR